MRSAIGLSLPFGSGTRRLYLLFIMCRNGVSFKHGRSVNVSQSRVHRRLFALCFVIVGFFLIRARYLVFLAVKDSEMNLVFSPRDILSRAFASGDGGTQRVP